ncbi:hypothetical protein OQJ26_07545 [Legionella sp. PATHC038]|uniref:hypothetical protein n=1 Tax=Legionella TaxID=445 RepID=UPI0022446367|nr:hypothetical protein [Legionella sp. PATHC038]MCW8398642.1 hypothetical protein [Legionella sp. PATHC038]
MPKFFTKKLVHPVSVNPLVQPVQNYIIEEKEITIKALEAIKQKLHSLTVQMLNDENEGKSEKNFQNVKKFDNSQYEPQFNEILESMREFVVTLETLNEVTVKKTQDICKELPDKIAYLKNHHTIEALRNVHDFFTKAQMHINNAARLLLVENAREEIRLQELEHSRSSCNIL